MNLMTTAEYAAHRKAKGLAGTTRQAVELAVKSGRITALPGGIDPTVADIQWEANTRRRVDIHGSTLATGSDAPTVAAPAPTAPGWSDAKAREQAARAERAEIELAELKGELIDRAGYERAAMQTHRHLRDALVDVLPAKLAPELAGLGADMWAIECRLRAAIRETLTAVAGAWKDEAAETEA